MDADSINPREQIFEKTISARIWVKLLDEYYSEWLKMLNYLVNPSQKIYEPFSLRTPDICAMQQESSKDLETVESTLYDVPVARSNLSARKMVIDVCDAIAERGGRLAGAGIVGILQKMEEDSTSLVFGKRTVVAMDGGLYEHYPHYKRHPQEAVTELLGSEISKNIII